MKPDKIKIGLDNVIVVPEEINIENTQPINVRNTYVATAKKEVINEAIELINNLKSFKDLVKAPTLAPTPEPPIVPTPVFVEPEIKPLEPVNVAPEAPNTDALPKVSENTFFDLNKVPTIDEIDENLISKHLQTKDTPDPDLIIRTGGENRLSGFLLWQAAYSELYFTDVLWPDFDKKELEKAINEYNNRKRNFGA